jgi:hypothetical protein
MAWNGPLMARHGATPVDEPRVSVDSTDHAACCTARHGAGWRSGSCRSDPHHRPNLQALHARFVAQLDTVVGDEFWPGSTDLVYGYADSLAETWPTEKQPRPFGEEPE